MKAASNIDDNKGTTRFRLQKNSAKDNAFIVSLLVIFILTFPLDAYRLKFVSEAIDLSIARVAIFILLIYYVIEIFRKIKISIYEVLMLLFIGWATGITLINGRFGGSYELMLTYSVIVYLIFYRFIVYGSRKTLSDLTNAIRLLIVILASFTIYTLFILATTGRPPLELPLGPFSAFFITGQGHIFQSGGFSLGDLTRVAIPFSRPHDLGATAVSLFFAFIILREESGSKNRLDLILVLSLASIIFLTGSRAIIFPFLLALFLFVVIYFKNYARSIIGFRLRSLISVSVVIGLLASVFVVYDIGQFSDNFSRIFLVLEGSSSQAHLNIRAAALSLAAENSFFLFVGHGVGAFSDLTGASSAHSTWFNFLVDVGIIGVVLFLVANVALLFKAKIFSYVGAIVFSLVVALAAMHFLYFLPTTIGMYVALGIAAAVVTRRKMRSA